MDQFITWLGGNLLMWAILVAIVVIPVKIWEHYRG
jgi:hypothetical protein